MAIKKHALVVDRPGGPLGAIASLVRDDGFEIARVSNVRGAVDLVGSARRLSVVVVNGEVVGAEGRWLISSIKEQQPDLPILWFAQDLSRGVPPAKIEAATASVQELSGLMMDVAREDFYSASFVSELTKDIQFVLAEFGVPTQAGQPCIKSNLVSLGEVNTFIAFTGEGAAGHLILSASSGDLTRPFRTKFPHIQFPGQDDLEDYVGEIGNHLGGLLKRVIELSGVVECRIGLPHFIRGSGASFRHRAGVPSLALSFGDETGRLAIELCIYRFDRTLAATTGSEQQIRPGQFNLL
jgi:CheY-specific phosphatase CheX